MKPIKCNFCESDKLGGHEHNCFILTGKKVNPKNQPKGVIVPKNLDKRVYHSHLSIARHFKF